MFLSPPVPHKYAQEYLFQTYTGKVWNLEKPKARDVHLKDILRPLSNISRFGGHTRSPYSVAQHLVYACDYCEYPLEALIHDWTEAYLGDLISPLKALLCPALYTPKLVMNYKMHERAHQTAIRSKLGLKPYVPIKVQEAVKLVDRRLLYMEATDLLRGGIRKDMLLHYAGDVAHMGRLFNERIKPWSHTKAYTLLCSRVRDLAPEWLKR